MMLIHQPPIRRLDLTVAGVLGYAEHAIRGREALGRTRLRRAAALVAAHEGLDLRKLGARDTERIGHAPQQLTFLGADMARSDGRLHLNLDESAREIAARADVV